MDKCMFAEINLFENKLKLNSYIKKNSNYEENTSMRILNRKIKRAKKRANMKRTMSIVLTLIIAFMIFSVINAFGDEKPNAVHQKPYEEINIQVLAGDTLWNIAEDFAPENQDIRDYVQMLIKINNLEGSVLKPGQIITVREYTDVSL